MIEIIPNWHPVFVHFTIGLLIVAAVFHIIAAFNTRSANYYQFENVANWNLWVGAGFAIITAIAGWFAFNSVDHDTPSHLAMLDHRNWALVTTAVFIALAVWSFRRAKKAMAINWLITLPLLAACGLLMTTGWKGGELVYRHGLGVMSLPDTGAHDHAGHDHDHGEPGGLSPDVTEQSDRGHEAEHEVGEVDHAHEHGDDADHGHDAANEAGMDESMPADTMPGTTSSDQANSTQQPVDGGHDHDHGDHPH